MDPFPPFAFGSRRIDWLATPQPTISLPPVPRARPAGEQAVTAPPLKVAKSYTFVTFPVSGSIMATPPGPPPLSCGMEMKNLPPWLGSHTACSMPLVALGALCPSAFAPLKVIFVTMALVCVSTSVAKGGSAALLATRSK